MKKLFSLIICLALLSVGIGVCAVSDDEKQSDEGISGFSAREVCIIPSEKPEGASVLQPALPYAAEAPVHFLTVKNIRLEDRYLPDILEQIDIISVAPRE